MGQRFTASEGLGNKSESGRSPINLTLSITPRTSQVAGPIITSKVSAVVTNAARRRRPPSLAAIHSKTG
jgi:hypothetical protein